MSFPGLDVSGGDREANLVLEALGQGVCVCDANGSILWANKVFRGFGPQLQERVQRICKTASTALAASLASPSPASRLSPSAPPRRRRYRIGLKKARKWFEVAVSPLPTTSEPAAPGPQARFVALVRDVTLAEEMRRKVEAIDRAGGELVKLDTETIEKMHIAERLRILESKVVAYAHDLLHFDHFAIRLLNERTEELELVMSSGLSAKACAIKLYARPTDNGISGLVAFTASAYICTDTASDPRYVYGLDQAGSSLTVPLKLFDKVLGIFNVESARKNAFTEADRQFAEIFGRYVAMALYILRLLLVERYTTNQKATGVVQGELSEPLNDLAVEAEALREQSLDPEVGRHVERIIKDVEAIRRRMKNVARGSPSLLGSEEAITTAEIDPLIEGKRILVVDNEPEISATVREILSRRGGIITVCDEGGSAIKLLDQWAASHDPDDGYHLVISDINLGDATGYDVFAAAKAASPPPPVILMTGFGYDPHHSIVRASQEGLQSVLFKPFQVEKLIEDVRKALSGPAAPAIM